MDQPHLMPLGVREWLPADDLAYYVSDVVDGLDISSIIGFCSGNECRGRCSYHPLMMTKLLIYSFVTGVVSSRRLESATYRSIASIKTQESEAVIDSAHPIIVAADWE